MKFRYRGGAKGFISRSVGRAVRRSTPDDQLGSCVVVAFILVLLTGSPILALVVLGILMSFLPFILILAFLIAIGIVVYYSIKKHYPQIFLSWFFLKENEVDGTILSFKEIQSRIKELIAT